MAEDAHFTHGPFIAITLTNAFQSYVLSLSLIIDKAT